MERTTGKLEYFRPQTNREKSSKGTKMEWPMKAGENQKGVVSHCQRHWWIEWEGDPIDLQIEQRKRHWSSWKEVVSGTWEEVYFKMVKWEWENGDIVLQWRKNKWSLNDSSKVVLVVLLLFSYCFYITTSGICSLLLMQVFQYNDR